MRGGLPVLVAVVKGRGPLGGNLTVCWAAEMEGSEVANLNWGWQRRWTPSCMDSILALLIHHSQPILVVLQVEESSAVPTTMAGTCKPWERELAGCWSGCRTPYPQY